MLPSSMHHKDRISQHRALSHQNLTYVPARTCVLLCTRILQVFLLSSLIVLSRSSSRFFFANYTRTADQNETSPASTQPSTGQSALHKYILALKSLFDQIMGLLLLPPSHFTSILPRTSVAGGLSRPWSGSFAETYGSPKNEGGTL